MRKFMLSPSEKWHEGEIAKSRDMVAVEACRGRSWNTFIFSHRDLRFYYASHISSSNSEKQIYKNQNGTTIKRQLRCDVTVCIYHLQKFSLSSFLLSATALLSEPPSIHFLWCWPGLYSCLWLFQGLWLCGSVDLSLLCACTCLSASGSLCTFWIYLFGSGSLVPWLQYYPY